jgi:hypothetical protein
MPSPQADDAPGFADGVIGVHGQCHLTHACIAMTESKKIAEFELGKELN